MSDEQKRVNTPDGAGVRLEWPAGSSRHFRELRGNGLEQTTHHVSVTPVLLDSGEVRFYSDEVVADEIRRSGTLK